MKNWSEIAFVFPGQGSQAAGMGRDVAEAFPVARDTFAEADDLLGFDLSGVCFNGPDDALAQTDITQPALFVTSIALLRALQSALPGVQPAFGAGHSLGEITALAAAGALTFADGVRLVRERGRLMRAAGETAPGAMAALLGLDAPAVRDVCAAVSAETGGVLVLANDNCPGQIVISGEVAAVDAGIIKAKEAGAKRAVKLAVSIASHSPLMAEASRRFAEALAATPFHEPAYPVFANVTAAPVASPDAIREELTVQLTRSVRWTESVQAMVGAGARTFIEIGSKDVLTNLLKRIDGSATGISLNSAAAIEAFVNSD
jgi:[acyl-carrier-protein] S-malonyltransferase